MEEKIKLKYPNLHRYLFTVTTLSKILAMFLFILFPFVGFYMGMQYQQQLNSVPSTSEQITAEHLQNPLPSPTILISPTPIDSSTWKTTTIENLSFKVPSNWSFFPADPTNWGADAHVYARQDFGDVIDSSGDVGPFSIHVPGPVKTSTNTYTIDSYINAFNMSGYMQNAKNVKKTTVVINNNLYTLVEASRGENYIKATFTENKNLVYVFTVSSPNPTKYFPYFDQILSTFKFTQ
jgi:hypothetical protein